MKDPVHGFQDPLGVFISEMSRPKILKRGIDDRPGATEHECSLLAADVLLVLDELGIRSVDALLDTLSTAMPGVADDTLAELRELFRFTQIRGVKTIRVRLYRDPVHA